MIQTSIQKMHIERDDLLEYPARRQQIIDRPTPASRTTPHVVHDGSFSVVMQARVLQERINTFGQAQSFFFGVVVDTLMYAVNLGPQQLRTSDGNGTFSNLFRFDTTADHHYVIEGIQGTDGFTVTLDHTTVVPGQADTNLTTTDCADLPQASDTGNALTEILNYELSHSTMPSKMTPTLLIGSGLAGLVAWRRLTNTRSS